MKRTKRIFLSPPHMGGDELRFVREAFDSNYIAPLGPMVDAFEREFAEKLGIPHAAALSSGTAAMHLAMRLLGVGQGDEVIASTLTFIGSVTPAVFQGADLTFVDCDRTSWNMDPDLLAEELDTCEKRGLLPKAVVPTDLYGQCCQLQRIVEICERYGVPVICDSAEALGAKYNPQITQITQMVHAGKGARAAVFSFNGNKIITTSGGGMLASEDEEFIEQARFLSQQARDAAPHYEHSQIGYNYRMSNILAAIGRGQLKVLEARVKRKREIFDYYKESLGELPGIEFMPEAPYGSSNRWLTVILISPEEFGAAREAVRLALEAENIEARPVWKPMHLQPVFQVEAQSAKRIEHGVKKRYKARVIGGEVAEDLFNRGLCLPSGTAMTDEDLNRVVEVIKTMLG
jgi:dTDP-4-amino-4,6-dideoxygalactose transaminase